MDSILHIGVAILEWLFFLGLAGSAVVVVWSFFEDMSTIFTKDVPYATEAPAAQDGVETGSQPATKTA